jgi:hypothetical protein
MAEKQKDSLKTHINADLADNNAGLISAEDMRHNLIDTVDSINYIVASGDTENKYKFVYNVKASDQNGAGVYGLFIAESGVSFPNSSDTTPQIHPYPGAGGIQHNDLAGLTTADPHTQYLPIDGSRPVEGNLPAASYWLGASGNANHGLKFVHRYADDPAGTIARNDIHVGNSGDFVFNDNSRFNSAQGVAKAWVSFDANTGTPVISGSYNVSSITDVDTGKFKVYFKHDVLGGNDYAAMANSSCRITAASEEDFNRNTVGLVIRGGDIGTPRYLSYYVLNESDAYVDAARNDLVVFGLGSGVVMNT